MVQRIRVIFLVWRWPNLFEKWISLQKSCSGMAWVSFCPFRCVRRDRNLHGCMVEPFLAAHRKSRYFDWNYC